MAQLLNKCKYTDPRNLVMPGNNELKILSLNIRSLTKNIDFLRENKTTFEKFDVLCFCETSCNLGTLPNGINDITLEGLSLIHI